MPYLGLGLSLASTEDGAGALNADKLALDLQFAADKTLTARKGPTPVFTRASGATQVGASGLIEYAPENLTIRSDDFGASEWNQGGSSRNLTVTANNTTSPSGATDADLLTVGATTTTYQVVQGLPNTGNVVSGVTYTVSCYFKANQVTRVSIYAGNPVTMPFDAMFDLTGAGSVVAAAAGTASIQQIGNGWYRCIITATAGATSNTSLRISPVSGTSRTYVGNSVDSFWAWGAQLEASPSARTYIPTTTAAVYGARFDHDPITLACKGLLIEESRTNLSSNSVLASAWGAPSAASYTNTQALAPDGTNTAWRLTEDTTNAVHFGSMTSISIAYISGTTYTVSRFMKAAGRTQVSLYLPGGIATGRTAVFDLSAGTVVSTEAGVTASIQNIGNGWYRCATTATAITSLNTHAGGSALNGGAPYLGDGTSGVFVWGHQLEAGSFPTSYIPTTTASVVRSADVCSITGSDFTSFYNQSAGSFACNYSIPAGFTGNRYAAAIEDTAGGPINAYTFRSTNSGLNFINTGGYTSTIGAITTTLDKHIIAYSGTSEFVYCKNSVIGSNTGSGTRDPSLLNRMGIGTLEASNVFSLNGHIASLRYYKKRLANAKLQALTA